MENKEMSRRSFLKGLGVGAAGLAMAGAMPSALAETPEVPEHPWVWHPIDKQKALEYTYKRWYQVGGCGGGAVAELLFGDVSPSGKLPVTFYKNEALKELPDFTDYRMAGRTYRYYTGAPLYPFGYGLSYAKMELSDLSANREYAKLTVHNTSRFAAGEVVELYIRDEDSPDAPTNPVLCGFMRLRLEAGEQRLVRIPIDPRAFTVVNAAGERVPGSGRWTLYAGFGQLDRRTEELTGRTCLSTGIR